MLKIPGLYQAINTIHALLPKIVGGGYAFPPLRIGCVLTHRCNLQCSMCFVWKRGAGRAEKDELSTQEWQDIFDQAPRFSIITFTGGEPLVRRDLRELLAHACKKHRVHLVTNGTMFDEETIEFCLNLAPKSIFGKGLLSIGVSLEGPADVHDAMVKIPGSYAKTTAALRSFAQKKREKKLKFPLLDLKIVICKETLNSLTDLYELANEIGLDIVSYQQCSTQESSYGISDAPTEAMFKIPPSAEMIGRETMITALNELTRRAKAGETALRFNPDMEPELFADRYQNAFPLKKFTCSAAWSVMHIGPTGTVYPCFSVGMGNVRSERLMRIWNGKPYRDFRNKLKRAGIFAGCVGCCVMKKK